MKRLKRLEFTVMPEDGGAEPVHALVERVLLAGYTGHERAKVREHIRELEALGVKPPERKPLARPSSSWSRPRTGS